MSKKYNINDIKKIALDKNGECLSNVYINVKEKLTWKCNEGHIWDSALDNIINGSWCPICGNLKKAKSRLRYNIQEINIIAKSRGGMCLSTEFKGMNYPLKWKCSNNHEWVSTPKCIIRLGTWCPYCSKKVKHTIDELKLIACENGGECLSEKYTGAHSKLTWKCSYGHIWEASASSIINSKSWCPTCSLKIIASKNTKFSLDDMHTIAGKYGGLCLSQKYVNSYTKLKWKCAEGHEWEAIPSSIQRGSWCPYCSLYLNERICRKYFELLFNSQFNKIKPKWLKIGPKIILELDGYSKNLEIAFEYQGRQHYEIVDHYDNDLKKRIEYDEIKKKLCELNGVKLIIVPYTIKIEFLEKFIRDECKKLDINIPRNEAINENELIEAYLSFSKEIEKLKLFAENKGGKLLTSYYVNAVTKMKWQCANGHIWEATPNNIINNLTWCAKCLNMEVDTIDNMKQLALEHGGLCLSEQYFNQKTKLRWRCAEGHEWEAIPRNIKNKKYWCPYCAGLKKWHPFLSNEQIRLEDIKNFATSKGGKCLSEQYLNSKIKLRWKCAKGHEWEAVPKHIIKSKSWCPYCSGLKKWHPQYSNEEARLEELRNYALSKGGKCLSTKYLGMGKKHKWQCAEGHIWYTRASHVIHSNSWCPICYINSQRRKEPTSPAHSHR